MWKNCFTPLGIVVFFCLNLFAVSYDRCKDILRDGLRDTISSNNSIDRQIANHQQFCSISKKSDLNDTNFHQFAKDNAKHVKKDDNSYGGGAGVSFLAFSFSGNYGQANNKSDLSEQEKEDFLIANKKKILDYYQSNCGTDSYEESLQTESILLSKVANANMINAWRECMLKQTGLFAELIPQSSLEDKELEYSVMVRWRSDEGTEITSIVLRYLQDKISGPYLTTQENNGFVKTSNICDSAGCSLKSGSNLPLTVIHKDRTRSANLTITAKTNTGILKSHVLILPKIVVPQPIILESKKDEEPYWVLENYCNNKTCIDYMKKISSERHKVGEKFSVQANQLNAGTCEQCRQLKNVRFGFKNCRYYYKARRGIAIFESNEDIAHNLLRYLDPFFKGRDFYSTFEVITGDKLGSCLQKDF